MNTYEIMKSNGTTKEFKADNLRQARKIAKELASDHKGSCYLYEGYTNKGLV